MTAREAIRLSATALAEVAPEEERFEARCLVAHCMNLPYNRLGLYMGRELNTAETELLLQLTERRKRHEPLQYLIGSWQFYGYDLAVDPAVLIPRPETEELVERALMSIRREQYRTVLDLCTGSGCIAIAIKRQSGAAVTATDISEAALAVARRNARSNGADITFLQGDLFAPLQGQRFDCIVSNPPYLTEEDMSALQEEVRFEPSNALYGGADGLSFYRRIADEYKSYLNPNGRLFLEIGAAQGEAVLSLFEDASLHRDLSGHSRIVEVRRR